MKSLTLGNKILLGIGVVLLLALLAGVINRQWGVRKIFIWKESYTRSDKNPYGSSITRDLLPGLFPGQKVTDVKKSAFDQLVYQYPARSAYVFVNDEVPLEGADAEELMRFVKAGNHVFIAASYFPEELEDSLGFYSETNVDTAELAVQFLAENKSFRYPGRYLSSYFEDIENPGAEVLATASGQPVLLRVRAGEGAFILSSTPLFYTNYFMVHPENQAFISLSLSLLPEDAEVFWDEYYKVSSIERRRRQGEQEETSGLFAFMMEKEALRWTLGLLAFVLLLFAVFESKRRQRIIPVVRPLPNTTLDFTRTVGQLYFQHQDHKSLAEKKIRFLLDFIRTRYYLKTPVSSPEFVASLSGKSGLPREEIAELVYLIKRIQKQTVVTENELIDLELRANAIYQTKAVL